LQHGAEEKHEVRESRQALIFFPALDCSDCEKSEVFYILQYEQPRGRPEDARHLIISEQVQVSSYVD
jgi:hypothetical protein